MSAAGNITYLPAGSLVVAIYR